MRTAAIYKMYMPRYDGEWQEWDYSSELSYLIIETDSCIPQVQFKEYSEEEFEKLLFELREYNNFLNSRNYRYVVFLQIENMIEVDDIFKEPDFLKYMEEKRLEREERERQKLLANKQREEKKKENELKRKKKQLEKLQKELGNINTLYYTPNDS